MPLISLEHAKVMNSSIEQNTQITLKLFECFANGHVTDDIARSTLHPDAVSHHHPLEPNRGRDNVVNGWNAFFSSSGAKLKVRHTVAEGDWVYVWCEVQGITPIKTSIDLMGFKDGLIVSHKDVQMEGTYP